MEGVGVELKGRGMSRVKGVFKPKRRLTVVHEHTLIFKIHLSTYFTTQHVLFDQQLIFDLIVSTILISRYLQLDQK